MRREAVNWLEEARADLRRARRAFEDGDYALAAFMSQQACEKAFKAVYVAALRRAPPRTHDLTVLYREVRGFISLDPELEDRLAEVSQYYVTARYPNAGLERPSESISRGQAARAVELAERVVEEASRAVYEGVGGSEG